MILFTSLSDGKSAGFLLSKADRPFLKMDLVNFLSNIHETILLDKVNTNRVIRAKACLEMLLERLSQKYGKMKRHWRLRINANVCKLFMVCMRKCRKRCVRIRNRMEIQKSGSNNLDRSGDHCIFYRDRKEMGEGKRS